MITLQNLPALVRRSSSVVSLCDNEEPLPSMARLTAKNGGKSTGNDYYLTGARILVPIRAFGNIELDPAGARTPTGEPVKSLVFAEREYRLDRGEDGLVLPWRVRLGNIVYCNPPYSQTRKWIQKADEEHAKRLSEILMLVASRTGTKAVQEARARFICFLDERLRFLDPVTLAVPTDAKGKPTSAMFDSMVMYYGMRETAFRTTFEPYGKVVRWS